MARDRRDIPIVYDGTGEALTAKVDELGRLTIERADPTTDKLVQEKTDGWLQTVFGRGRRYRAVISRADALRVLRGIDGVTVVE